MLIYVNKREKMKHFFLFMLILCQFISISQSDRRTTYKHIKFIVRKLTILTMFIISSKGEDSTCFFL